MSKVEETLTSTKTRLIRTFPFLAFVVVSAKYKITNDPMIKTMAATVSGTQPLIYIDEEFMMEKLTCVEERSFVIAHELMHLYFMHLGRQRDHGYHPKLWNVATDYFINYLLSELKSPNLTFPKWGGLYDEKYADMSSDEIYAKLLEDADHNMEKALSPFGEVGEGGDSPFDHVAEEDLTEDQKANIKAQLAASLQGGQLAGSMRNSALVKSLYELLEPTICWKDMLREYITKSRDEFYSYRRYNSRSGEIILPSSDGDSINLLFGIDTSGSMSNQDLAEGLTELKSIVDDFANWKVQFVTCEMDVDVVGDYSSEDGDDFTSFAQDYKRGGGTDMNPIIEHAESTDETPSAVIIVTDGYLSDELMSSHLPIIVVVTKSGNKDFESGEHLVVHIE